MADFELQKMNVKNITLGLYRRGDIFFDEQLRVTNILNLASESKYVARDVEVFPRYFDARD